MWRSLGIDTEAIELFVSTRNLSGRRGSNWSSATSPVLLAAAGDPAWSERRPVRGKAAVDEPAGERDLLLDGGHGYAGPSDTQDPRGPVDSGEGVDADV